MSFSIACYSTMIMGILTLLFMFLMVYLKYAMTYWQRRGVFTLPTHFLFGSAKNLVFQKGSIGDEFKTVYDTYKAKGLRYGGFYIFSKPFFFVVDIDLIKNIMVTDFNHFVDRNIYINEEVEPISANLVGLKGNKWRNVRSKLNPHFTSSKIKSMYPFLVESGQHLNDLLEKINRHKQVMPARDCFTKYTLEIIGRCALGLEVDTFTSKNSEFVKYCYMTFNTKSIKRSLVLFLSFLYPEVLRKLNILYIPKSVEVFFTNIITNTVHYRRKTNVRRNDILQMLIDLENNDNNSKTIEEPTTDNEIIENNNNLKGDTGTLTLEEIIAQCFIISLGGFETTSVTLSLLLFELAKNEDIQNAVREEIKSILPKHNNTISYEAISEMTYLEKCIHETIRKYPSTPILTRVCTEDYTVPGTSLVIEKGTSVVLPIFAIHRDPDFYPDPEKFDPERFSVEGKASRESSTYLGFGNGPRYCLGMKLGIVETKVAIAMILMNYKFTVNPNMVQPVTMDPAYPFTMSLKHPVLLDFQKIVPK